MDATTMLSTPSLAAKLRTDFPQFQFIASDRFQWSATKKCIFYEQDSQQASYLLHELSHAILEHSHYNRDIKLLEMERDAWDYTVATLSKPYEAVINEGTVQDALDTYRDWLHSRSTCPACHAIGIQTQQKAYTCPACNHRWLVNEARTCALRRYSIK